MLMPIDYSESALHCAETKNLMDKITFSHGGQKYDDLYPEGIPTSVTVTSKQESFDR